MIVFLLSRGNKDPEFRAWLVEERTINPETLQRDKEKKEFLRFVEDFNTGKLRVWFSVPAKNQFDLTMP